VPSAALKSRRARDDEAEDAQRSSKRLDSPRSGQRTPLAAGPMARCGQVRTGMGLLVSPFGLARRCPLAPAKFQCSAGPGTWCAFADRERSHEPMIQVSPRAGAGTNARTRPSAPATANRRWWSHGTRRQCCEGRE
jgi:hypothetical protein